MVLQMDPSELEMHLRALEPVGGMSAVSSAAAAAAAAAASTSASATAASAHSTAHNTAQLGAHPRRARGATPCTAQVSRLAVVRKRRRRDHLRWRSRDDVGGPPPVHDLHVRRSAFGLARDIGGALGGGTLGGVTIGWTHGDQVHSQEAQRAADAKVELCCRDGHAPILAPVLVEDPYAAGDRAGREGGAADGRERHSAAIRGGIRRDLAQSGAIWLS